MSQSRTRTLILVMLVTIIPTLNACQRDTTLGAKLTSPASPRSSLPDTTITFAAPTALHSTFAELVDQFKAEHPDIAVRLVDLDALLDADPAQGFRDKAVLQVAQGADSMIWWWPPLYRGQPLLLDLAPFIETDSAFNASDFYPNLLRADSRGHIFFVPASAGVDVLFYNKALFDAAGQPYPQPGWTLGEFLQTVTDLTQMDMTTGRITQYGFLDTLPNGLEFILLSVGGLVDTGAIPPAIHLDSPEMSKAVQRYVQLVADGVTPALSDLDEEQYLLETDMLINNGQVAIWTDAVENLDYRAEHQPVGIVTFPRPETDIGVPLLPGMRYAISAGTPHPDAAWRWLSWLSRQNLHSAFPNAIPARRSLTKDASIWSSLPKTLTISYQWALTHPATESRAMHDLFTTLTPGPRNQIYRVLQKALGQILEGQVTVKTALAEAQIQAVGILANSYGMASLTPTPFAVTSPTATPPEPEIVPITFVALLDVPALEDAATAFHQIKKTIRVNVRRFQIPPAAGTSRLTIRSMAEQSDCFMGSGSLTGDDLKALLNLDPLLEADVEFDLDDFYPVMLTGLRRDGKLWGLPAGGVVRMLYYNQDIFDRDSIPYPRSGWTLDDFLKTARTLRQVQQGSGEFPYLSFDERLDADYILDQWGVARYVPDTDPPKPQFDDKTVLRALGWYLDLARVHEIKPQYAFVGPDNLPDWDTNLALIDDGRIAMWATFNLGGSSPYSSTLNIGYAPMPRNLDGLSTIPDYAVSYAYFISAHADPAQAEACWQWIVYLTTQPDLTKGLSPRRSVFATDAYRQRLSSDLYDVYAYVLDREGEQEQGVSQQSRLPLGPAEYWFWRAVDESVAGQDLPLALGEAQYNAEEYIACVATGREDNLKERVIACARGIDADYPGQ